MITMTERPRSVTSGADQSTLRDRFNMSRESMQPLTPEAKIRSYYSALREAYGPLRWWPAKTPFEVIVGAYLTQNTSWKNVEQALQNLRRERLLSVAGIRRTSIGKLEQLLRPSGYFRQKAARLKNFVDYLDVRHRGSLARMFRQPTMKLRSELLALNGVGPETADSILLYAGEHPIFVVDAYTRRIFYRHGILSYTAKYDEMRGLVERAFRENEGTNANLTADFNELHALIVHVGKKHCQKQPKCEGCPLQWSLPAIPSHAPVRGQRLVTSD
jgi:endonuclease-3 related protein